MKFFVLLSVQNHGQPATCNKEVLYYNTCKYSTFKIDFTPFYSHLANNTTRPYSMYNL